MVRLALVLIVLGGASIYFGVQEFMLAGIAKPEPQELTCKQLHDAGYGDNAHVSIDEFCTTDAFVYTADSSNPSRFLSVFIPLMPTDSDYHLAYVNLEARFAAGEEITEADVEAIEKLADFAIILKTTQLRSQSDVMGFPTPGERLQGLIINRIESLQEEERKLLRSSYPQADFDKVLILEHGRKPAAGGMLAAYLGGGGLLVLVAIGLLLRGSSSSSSAPRQNEA